MKILITTGIYPPKIGGPAQYAKNLELAFQKMDHKVEIKTYGVEDSLPTGIRHLVFLWRILPSVLNSDIAFALDTFSVGLPTVIAAQIFWKKTIIRTGGDFLWEQYVERTGKKVLLRNFYKEEKNNFTIKEKVIFRLTKWTLLNVSKIIFSTAWQRDIFIEAYGVKLENTDIVENYYGPKEGDVDALRQDFSASTRYLTWKNLDVLKNIFEKIKVNHQNIELYTQNLAFEDFMNQIKNSYAVILVSLGDISPNLILDAIRYNRPFICTKEIGILPRIKDVGIFVDPLNKQEIENAVLKLLDKNEYEKARQKVRNFTFTHTWDEIAKEFLDVYNLIRQ
jgi:glycosyltransferase involved in cell wall biosynthesis